MATPGRDEALAALRALVEISERQSALLDSIAAAVRDPVVTSPPIDGVVVLTVKLPRAVHAGLLSWPFPPADT